MNRTRQSVEAARKFIAANKEVFSNPTTERTIPDLRESVFTGGFIEGVKWADNSREKFTTMGSGFMTDKNLTYEEKGILFLLLAATEDRTYSAFDLDTLLISNGKIVNSNSDVIGSLIEKKYIREELYKGDKPILKVYKVYGNPENAK